MSGYLGFNTTQLASLKRAIADFGGGGGDASELGGVTVNFEAVQPLGNAQLVYIAETIDGLQVINIDVLTLIDGFTRQWLEELPGFGEGQVLSVVGGNPTWITPT